MESGRSRGLLDGFFRPRTVAVIGATDRPGSVGRMVLQNLSAGGWEGDLYPVNSTKDTVGGLKARPSIGAVPKRVDLAVIVTPAATVPAVIRECVEARVRCAVVISAGFKETGAAGAALETEALEEARRGNLRIIGPNCIGVMNPLTGLNATFAQAIARPGNVAFLSQSGALCSAILDWSLRELVGFSAFVSIGSMLDVGWGDLIDYFGSDPKTKSIVIYMESVGDARAFMSAAREVALAKPIIVIKAGRTQAAAQAAASHTGALTGSDEVLEAAFRRCGVLRVNRIADLFYMAEVLSRQPRPRGPKLAIVTNAGGPGVLATDAFIAEGGRLAEFTPATFDALNELLPPHWSHHNPVDILGDAGPDRYARALDIVARDPDVDGLLLVMAPQGMIPPSDVAERLQKEVGRIEGKPVLASFMGGPTVARAEELLNQANIPTFPYPDTAALFFQYMWKYSENLRALYETPTLAGNHETDQLNRAAAQIDAIRAKRRTLLSEVESKELLAAYGIPVVPTHLATTEDEAVGAARALGYPVVLKLHSETVTHKSDIGGVQLHLRDESAVRAAFEAIAACPGFLGVTVQPMVKLDGYELILGASPDPQFGPVLLFGAGGPLVEIFRDHTLALPPLNSTLGRRMMERTRIFSAFAGIRGRAPVDLAHLTDILVRFSRLIVEQRWIREVDINPLLVTADRIVALDARVILYPPETPRDELPRLAIRPYPHRYRFDWTMRDGAPAQIRPIRPEDEPLMVQFHETLSERTVYLRYFQMMKLSQRVSHERLTRICFIDYDREMALVAERQGEDGPQIIGVARMTRLRGRNQEAEFAVIISDRWQRSGAGTELMRRLIDVARGEKVSRLVGEILPENRGMQRVCEKFGFHLRYALEDGVVEATLDVAEPAGVT